MVTSFLRIKIPHINSTIDPITVKIHLPLQRNLILPKLDLRLHLMSDTYMNTDYHYKVSLNTQPINEQLKERGSGVYDDKVEILKERCPGISAVDDLEGKMALFLKRKAEQSAEYEKALGRTNSEVSKSDEISEDIKLDSKGSIQTDSLDQKLSYSEVEGSQGTQMEGQSQTKDRQENENGIQDPRPTTDSLSRASVTTTWSRKFYVQRASKKSKSKLERLIPNTLSGSQWIGSGCNFDFSIEDDYMSELLL